MAWRSEEISAGSGCDTEPTREPGHVVVVRWRKSGANAG